MDASWLTLPLVPKELVDVPSLLFAMYFEMGAKVGSLSQNDKKK